ncbi:MAG: membrane protein insertase YidC, partial [Proteobacteria bacterium]|nr:membrane protein insertase YidC [Pseudomonadota bacterium]
MDNARLIIAIVLSILVFIVWDYFFVGPKMDQKTPPKLQAEQPVRTKPSLAETEKVIVPTVPAPINVMQQAARTITVETPFYTVKISEKGAEFKSFVLKKYRQSIDAQSPFYEMISQEMRMGTVSLGVAGKSLAGLNEAVYSADLKTDTIDIQHKTKEISFAWVSLQGVIVEKKFVFSPDTYLIGLDVIVKNGSQQTFKDNLVLSLVMPTPGKASRIGFEGPCAMIDKDVERVKIKKIK